MAKQVLPLVTGELCNKFCDLQGPAGRIHFSDTTATVDSTNRRTETRFTIEYGGAKATCVGPATISGRSQVKPFACSIIQASPNLPSYSLELAHGCTSGNLTRHGAGEPDSDKSWGIRTDTVNVLGSTFAAREVALVDARESIVFSDAPGGGIDLHTKVGVTLDPAQILAVVAVHTFEGVGGTPEACVVKE